MTDHIDMQVIDITPEVAKQLLTKNIGNRPINKIHVDRLSRAMLAGEWKFNGDTICINGDRLIDGQHRLTAVVESGITIRSILVSGLASSVFDTKDIGRHRSAADTLSVIGEVNTRKLAAALSVVDQYMTGRVGEWVRYSNVQMEALLQSHPRIRESVRKCGNPKIVRPSVLAACHYLFSLKDAELADAFIEKVMHGKALSEGEPAYVLRERLLANTLSQKKLSMRVLMAFIIKAWNAERDGKHLRVLVFRERPFGKQDKDNDSGEAFPVIK